ncbi:MAG: hypothetical protein V4578_24405, partial [Pseudomonadota bacterium]
HDQQQIHTTGDARVNIPYGSIQVIVHGTFLFSGFGYCSILAILNTRQAYPIRFRKHITPGTNHSTRTVFPS